MNSVIIYAVADVTEEGKPRHTPPHLVVGSTVTVRVRDEETSADVLFDSVDVTEDNAATDPEVLAAEMLAAGGWRLGECGPEWFPDEHGMHTTGDATKIVRDDADEACPECGAARQERTCAGCGVSARLIDCGHYDQPRPISAATGTTWCDTCFATTITSEPEMTPAMTARKREWLDSLRQMVDFLEERPELINLVGVSHLVFAHSPERFAELVRELGEGEKSASEGNYRVVRRFGRHEIDVYTNSVCTKVQTGVAEELIEQAAPPENPDDLVEVKHVTRHVVRTTVPVYEWQCPESVLSL